MVLGYLDYFVSADHRGKGLARKLLAAIEEDYVGQTLRLRAKPYKDKAKSKEALIRLYTSLGFAPYDDEGWKRLHDLGFASVQPDIEVWDKKLFE